MNSEQGIHALGRMRVTPNPSKPVSPFTLPRLGCRDCMDSCQSLCFLGLESFVRFSSAFDDTAFAIGLDVDAIWAEIDCWERRVWH